MSVEVIVTGIIGLCTTVISAWTSWFFTRRKYNSEVDGNYIENLQKALETYDAIIAHNKSEIDYLIKKNEELNNEVAALTKKNDKLRDEVSELRRQLLNLTMNICMDLTCTKRVKEVYTEETNKEHTEDTVSDVKE